MSLAPLLNSTITPALIPAAFRKPRSVSGRAALRGRLSRARAHDPDLRTKLFDLSDGRFNGFHLAFRLPHQFARLSHPHLQAFHPVLVAWICVSHSVALAVAVPVESDKSKKRHYGI